MKHGPPTSLKNELKGDDWFEREVFDGALLLIPGCAFLYLSCQSLMGSPWSEQIYTVLVGIGCLGIRALCRVASPRIAHLSFMLVTLGLFIPSWLGAGGMLSPVRYVSVIFFSLHVVLFPGFKLVYIFSIWMLFTLSSLGIEYIHPEWVSGRPFDTSISPTMVVEHGVVEVDCRQDAR